ncbi:MAG TPA: ABC transporter substrate-binding protein, partial [Terrimicrobiaceae bacterium]
MIASSLFLGRRPLLGLLFVLAVVGCGPSEKRADLIFINGAEPETLDPSILVGQPEGRIAQALFEGLTTFDAKGNPGPGMAESWTISEDKRMYTFKIRPDAKWSDGKPLTARDFVESWKRTLSPETAAT